MINLLPPADLENILYARRNTHLLHWLIAIIFAIAGVGAVIGAGHVAINRATDQVSAQVQSGTEQLKAQKLQETQTRVEDISASLKLATQVLSRQVILSELIPQIGGVLPSGTALSSLQLNKIEGGLDLVVSASDYQTATQVQVNLEDEDNKIFQKADINAINCAGTEDPRYACQVTIRALFAEENPYSFLQPEAKP